MIIEGLITCGTPEGPHVAALGPVVDPGLSEWTLRPFQTSRIFAALRDNPVCIFHVIDDPLPIVRLVLGQSPELTFESQPHGGGWVIQQACHWYQLEIVDWNIDSLRSEARARRIAQGELRPFWGWNRAKHALLEAAILISRAHLLPDRELSNGLECLRSAIEKTAGPSELAAWQLIDAWRQTRHDTHD